MDDLFRLYLIGVFAWLLIGVLVTMLAKTSRYYREREAAPKLARWTLAAPLWPLALAFFAFRGTARFILLALGKVPA